MGRTKRTQMTPSTPRTQGEALSASIRAYLCTAGILASQHEASNMAPSSPSSTISEDSQQPTDLRDSSPPDWTTLRTEITTLRSSLSALEGRVEALETAGTPAPSNTQKTPDTQSRQITDLRLHVEDLDNRSRRHNIRVRGLQESQGPEDLKDALIPIFINSPMNRPPEARLYIDRAHHTLHPKPPPSALPRDVICHIQNFQLKEAIMKAARSERTWRIGRHRVELYNNLSHITLQTRRALRPVTTALQDQQIRYRRQLPFSLVARKGTMEATIRTPEDVPIFLEALGLPPIQIRDWTNCPLNDRLMSRLVTHTFPSDEQYVGMAPPRCTRGVTDA
ncbi:Hypothetical predicted protein [Pelobates cultripes]|uniref:L1 transposable element RRM domain-containing protein n=1 Tax=Pelobates cultripes TaxID=61616 RepID=A0AAD1SGF7_PELCU|nr:Hypothetical predicted protein [Pelobates cultripes]